VRERAGQKDSGWVCVCVCVCACACVRVCACGVQPASHTPFPDCGLCLHKRCHTKVIGSCPGADPSHESFRHRSEVRCPHRRHSRTVAHSHTFDSNSKRGLA
jgi:hypothetical protein